MVSGIKKQDVFLQPGPTGSFKCNNCKVECPILVETKNFKSTNTGETYEIRQYMNCDGENVIYLATCKKCTGQYVGKARQYSSKDIQITRGR